MKLRDIFDELDDCLNEFAVTGKSDNEDRGNLLIIFGEFVKKLLDDCGIRDANISFNPNKRMVDARSKTTGTLYQFGIMLKSYSLFLDVTPPTSKKIGKGWSIEVNSASIYTEAKQLIESLL